MLLGAGKVLICLVVLVPIFLMVSTSLKAEGETTFNPSLIWYRAHDLAVLTWSSQANGWFAALDDGPGAARPNVDRVYGGAANLERRRRTRDLARRIGATPNFGGEMRSDPAIRIHPENPRYFLFRGQPRVLLCATEHYGSVINRAFDFERYLNAAADRHQTLTRLFLLFRELQSARNPYSPCKPESPDYIAPGPGRGRAKLSTASLAMTWTVGTKSSSCVFVAF